jgi:hypothetical protein
MGKLVSGGNSHQLRSERRLAGRIQSAIEDKLKSAVMSESSTPTPSETNSIRQKLHEIYTSTPLWTGVGVLVGLIISQLSVRYAIVVVSVFVWVIATVDVFKVGLFKGRKWSVLANSASSFIVAVILAGISYGTWKLAPPQKDAPTLDQQIDAFARRFPWIANPPQSPDQTKQAKQTVTTITVSPVPKLKISLSYGKKDERTLTLDNRNGDSDLTDFEVNGLGYYLDKKGVANEQARVESHYVLPGPLNFKPFAVAKGKTKRIDLSSARYGIAIRMYRPENEALRSFDDMWHYICLRLKFTQEATGEKWVHYVVMSPSGDLYLLAEQPEHTGSKGQMEQGGQKGWPYTISSAIKADARAYYGTEFREYEP